MTIRSADLLHRLGSGVRPEGAGAPRAAFESMDFGAILSGATQGAKSTGRPMTLASDLGVDLSSEQLARIAAATDAAEAAGATRLHAVVDEHALTIDVLSRTIESVGPAWRVAVDIDAAVVVPPGDPDEVVEQLARALRDDPGVPAGPSGVRNASLARVLETIELRESDRSQAGLAAPGSV